jgi:hypothetical protein
MRTDVVADPHYFILRTLVKYRIAVQSTLTIMLAICARTLFLTMPISPQAVHDGLVQANQRLRFTRGIGVTIDNRLVDLTVASQKKRTVAFVLRNRSLAEDLAFWRDMAELLRPVPSLRLVGYCDSAACVSSARAVVDGGRLDILAYGEVVDTQAVLNADAHGDFIVGSAATSEVTMINWRYPMRQARDIARRVPE